MNNKVWHNLSKENILLEFNSSNQGLTSQEAEKHLTSFGPNKLKEAKKISVISLFLDRLGFFTNKWLILAFFITLATVLPILYIPSLNKIFEVVPLNFGQFLSCLFFSSLVLIVVETVKFIGNYNRRKRKYIMGAV